MTARLARRDVVDVLAAAAAIAAVRTTCSPVPLGAADARAAVVVGFLCTFVAIALVLGRLRAQGADAGTAFAGGCLAAAALAADAAGRMTPPQWATFAAIAVLLDRPTPRRLVALVVAVACWAALSPLAVAGAVLATVSLATVRDAPAPVSARGRGAAIVGVWLALLATPRGFGIVSQIATVFDVSRANESVLGASLAGVAPVASRAGFMLVLVLLACAPDEAVGRPPRDLSVAFAALALALANGSLLACVGIATAPVAVLRARGLFPRGTVATPASRPPAVLAGAVLLGALALVACATPRLCAVHRAAQAPLLALAARLDRGGALGRTACFPVAACVVLAAHLVKPGFTMLVDPRAPAPAALAAARAVATTRGWRTALRAADVRTLVFTRDRPLATLVAEDVRDWRPLAAVGPYAAYGRVR